MVGRGREGFLPRCIPSRAAQPAARVCSRPGATKAEAQARHASDCKHHSPVRVGRKKSPANPHPMVEKKGGFPKRFPKYMCVPKNTHSIWEPPFLCLARFCGRFLRRFPKFPMVLRAGKNSNCRKHHASPRNGASGLESVPPGRRTKGSQIHLGVTLGVTNPNQKIGWLDFAGFKAVFD